MHFTIANFGNNDSTMNVLLLFLISQGCYNLNKYIKLYN